MNKQASQGVIFFVVLVFLQLITLLGLLALMKASNAIKTGRHLWQHQNQILIAEQVLSHLEAQVSSELNCFVTGSSMSKIERLPLGWWQQHACGGQYEHLNYYFVVQALGKDPCSVIQKRDNRSITTNYYRITLMALPYTLKGVRVLLQSVIAKQANEISPCQNERHLITLGRQQWREI